MAGQRLAVVAGVLGAALFGVTAPPADAANLTTTRSGPVTVEFTFSDANFINTMSVTSPVNQQLFDTEASRIGTRVSLGNQNAGTTFVFRLLARTNGTFTWSSDPAANSDGDDHLRITELRDGDATLDDRVYLLAWEDDENLGDMDFNDAVGILRIGADTDGDGLFDDWERFGIDANNNGSTNDPGERDIVNGFDQNGNGTIEANERANPQHKDIFLELDWLDCAVAGGDCAAGDTHSHRPQAAAITNVRNAFANHPSVSNPDGQNGINVHIQVSNAIAHANVVNFNGAAQGCGVTVPAQTGFGDFDTLKAANMQNEDVRRFAFHYALAIHVENQAGLTSGASRFSGCGEQPGNDFYISFGLWGAGRPTVQEEAGTIMHELGHNLNLDHGGGDAVNNKPNYLSIMNYSFQLRGIPASNRIDYSRQLLPLLNESNPPGLNEAVGIQDGTDQTLFFCPGQTGTFPATLGAGTGGINWDCNTPPTFTTVSADINRDNQLGALNGFDDWQRVLQNLAFQTMGGFQDGVHPDLPQEELDLQRALDFHLLGAVPNLSPVANQSGVYSDPVTPYALQATDTDSSCSQLTFSAAGLPVGLAVGNNNDCSATISGAITSAAGGYGVTYKVTDELGNQDSEFALVTVGREDAVVTPAVSNPAAVSVASPGGVSGALTLAASVTEVADSSPGNIALAVPVTYTLTPVLPGPSFTCVASSGSVVGASLSTTCTFTGLPVNVYDVGITVGGSFYRGEGSSVLTVFDRSLGFVTGGATLTRAGNRANVGFSAKFVGRSARANGSLLYIEHRTGGDFVLKSNAISSMAIVRRTAVILGKATLNGVGNHSFRATAVDNDPGGTGDQFGLIVKNSSGATVLSFAPVTIRSGNIVVPQ
jgi:hypothetical protein